MEHGKENDRVPHMWFKYRKKPVVVSVTFAPSRNSTLQEVIKFMRSFAGPVAIFAGRIPWACRAGIVKRSQSALLFEPLKVIIILPPGIVSSGALRANFTHARRVFLIRLMRKAAAKGVSHER